MLVASGRGSGAVRCGGVSCLVANAPRSTGTWYVGVCEDFRVKVLEWAGQILGNLLCRGLARWAALFSGYSTAQLLLLGESPMPSGVYVDL